MTLAFLFNFFLVMGEGKHVSVSVFCLYKKGIPLELKIDGYEPPDVSAGD